MSDLTALPGYSPALGAMVALLRAYTRDYGELNRLVSGEESSDSMLALAVMDAVDRFNGTAPLIGNFSLENLLSRGQRSLLLRMATCNVLEGVGMLQTRNHINYSSGGTNVGVNDKTPLIMKWIEMLKPACDQEMAKVKIAMNISGILGDRGVGSEYAAINSQLPL